ncbi:DUF305 domain-containing protein [Deinococcus peraridilitoris]|uniref:DUF305 domain-containing protein n=1 Tax=Deinococcus peraridilitoris (strain DSM 19664 / LMG 22246 / CIP 109416 / KR-200) TaxID=937777 RepID=L0A271_DEIPD|nr:DUF305 domain-containing protein [Deinococcus peraridilitoris]AFZ67998.1 hypothetical protein Deipe_2533 [Deinococcus peraridilitoris DSM 19664]
MTARSSFRRALRVGISGPYRLLLGLVLLALVLGAALIVQGRAARHSANVNFTRHMIQHHLQAVDMATRLYDRTNDPSLKAVTYDILTSQIEQVGQMRAWLTLWGESWGGQGMKQQEAAAMGMASPENVAALSALPLEQAEVLFLQLMIRHHEGALSMIDGALGQGLAPHAAALARQMRGAQGSEIGSMKNMLSARGAVPLPPLAPGSHSH